MRFLTDFTTGFLTMVLQSSLVLYPIKMSQKFVNLSLRLLVFALILVVESRRSTFNITRYTEGDLFQNINSSRSCNESGARCVLDGENSPFCGFNCCYCNCEREKPTYLQRNGTCRSDEQLMSILKAQSVIQGCEYRAVVGDSYRQCHRELLATLNTRHPGNRSVYLCPWSQKPTVALLHFKLTKELSRCEILPKESLYLDGSWENFLSNDKPLSTLFVEIHPDPDYDENKLFLKWTNDIGKQYDGRIFSLKLRCHGDEGNVSNSCLFFKKNGSLTDIVPTSKPSVKSTRVSKPSVKSTRVSKPSVKSIRVTSTPVQRNTTTGAKTSSASTEINLVSSTVRTQIIIVTSLKGHQQKFNIILIALVALGSALIVVLTCLVVICIVWKRKRRFAIAKRAKPASNPVYERGASDTLKMAKLSVRSGEEVEEGLEYQPLVENTKPAERSDSLPGYRSLSVGQRPANGNNPGIRSSNYLSLIQDEPQDERDYQTLVDNANPQKLETVDEEKIPDYQELEERTDSEDSFETSPHHSVDSYSDHEEPPADTILRKIKYPATTKQPVNGLSSDFHDYDEPEGIIVLSDNEDNHEQAIKDNTDFHDYADLDDNPEQAITDDVNYHDYADLDDDDDEVDNKNRHVVPDEDSSCYHDYADPDE